MMMAMKSLRYALREGRPRGDEEPGKRREVFASRLTSAFDDKRVRGSFSLSSATPRAFNGAAREVVKLHSWTKLGA